MSNIRCLIVDDEPLATKVVEKYCKKVPFLEVFGVSYNPIEALQIIEKESIDLVFLDINMPELSGISLAKAVSNGPSIIFTTAYPEFAVEGFELDAIDYLVKPFSFERFLKAINRVVKKEVATETQTTPTPLLVKADRRIYAIPMEKIFYFQAFGDYVKIFTTDKTIVPKTTLSQLEKELSTKIFCRTHRSYIVRTEAIEYIEGNHIKINNNMIPVAQNYKNLLLDRLS